MLYAFIYHSGGVKYTCDWPQELPTLVTLVPPVNIPVPV